MIKSKMLRVTYDYEIEIDDENSIVKDYENEQELLDDIASYRFMILPVIGDGVNVKDVTLVEYHVDE